MTINSNYQYIDDLEFKDYRALFEALDYKQSWLKILSAIHENNEIERIDITRHPNDKETEGEKLLNHFRFRYWPIDYLLEISRSCGLYNVLAVFMTEPMVIQNQPNQVPEVKDEKLAKKLKDTFTLDFDVFSIPMPTFQWYKNSEILVDQTESKLYYNSFRPSLEGTYHCIAKQDVKGKIFTLESNRLIVEALPELEVDDRYLLKEYNMAEGLPFEKCIKANGYPEPQFEWTLENKVLENVIGDTLHIEQCTLEHSGTYRCQVSNQAKSIIIEFTLKIKIFNPCTEIDNSPVPMKIALIIGNLMYEPSDVDNNTPRENIENLGEELKKRNFQVIIKFDLNAKDMEKLIEETMRIVLEGSYILFFYSGHGFSVGYENYMKPVDSPRDSFNTSKCFSESRLKKLGLDRKPKLLFLMMDMCLTLIDDEETYRNMNKPEDYEADRNLLVSYSTTERLYSSNLCNRNFYLEELIKNIKLDLPVQEIAKKTMGDAEKSYENKLNEINLEVEMVLKKNSSTPKGQELYAKMKILNNSKSQPSKYDTLTTDFDLNAPIS